MLLHLRENLGKGVRQREGLLRGERTLLQQHLLPGRPLHPGHQHGIGQVGFAAQQVSVAVWGEHGAARNLQAGQAGKGCQLLGLGDEGRRAKARLTGRRAPHPLPLPAGEVGGEGTDDPRPAFLALWEARRGGVFGDAVGGAGDGQFIVGVGAEGHRSPHPKRLSNRQDSCSLTGATVSQVTKRGKSGRKSASQSAAARRKACSSSAAEGVRS